MCFIWSLVVFENVNVNSELFQSNPTTKPTLNNLVQFKKVAAYKMDILEKIKIKELVK